ncbi:MAG: phosphotransferase family protein [Acidobacteriia bacterium]|nr:phosphotransferase family protein [Methyloceanibacter sp.]MBX5470846.1 phosphotransferase family protein [Acetobacteraceae bacterium]MCL6490593.1 phosphotransferase family protein [Terriglobia bacterium]
MTEATGSSAFGFEPSRLDAFLREKLGVRGEPVIERISGGQSNPTFFITYPNRRLVLRKQPAGPILPSAHAVDREFRVLAALAKTDVPVPPVVLFYPERDLVGTPFYLMEHVEGRVFHDAALHDAPRAERKAMYFAMAETLARLHDVDWKAVGLEGFGKPGNYFARQIARWTRQWESIRFREIPELSQLAAWLAAHIPEDDETTISHGDYRMGNLLFHPTKPEVVAVLDWELSTLGHPLADLAFSCIAWHSRPEEYGGLMGLDLAELDIPTEAEYVERYEATRRHGSGARLRPFHLAFALFRFAVIFEGIAVRARIGTAVAENAAVVGDLSIAFARHALAVIDE